MVRHCASRDGLAPRELIDDSRYGDITDYVAAPMRFLSGVVHAVIVATREPGGFGDAHLIEVEAIVEPMARIGEIPALTRTAANLLDTYVSWNAG